MEAVNNMGFMDAVKTCFSKYADFSGRARRKEYWYFVLFNCIVQVILTVIGMIIFGSDNSTYRILASIYSLAVLVPGLAVTWRRLHDIGKSGAFYFIGLIPLVGWIIVLVYFCKDSEPGTNQYGPSPKYPNRYDF